MDDQLRTMLRQKADQVRFDPEMPSSLRRRSRRRRLGTALLTGVLVVGLGAGGLAGARELLGGRDGRASSPAEPRPEYDSSFPENPREFVSEFMEARISGAGAEVYLSSEAAAQFEESGGLYRRSGIPHVGFTIASMQTIDVSSYEIRIYVVPEVGQSFPEWLFVGAGTNVEGSPLPLVIRGVELPTEGTGPSAEEIFFPTWSLDSVNAVPTALIEGVLQEQNGCLLIDSTLILWEDNYSYNAGEISDRSGGVVASVGQPLSGGGGGIEREIAEDLIGEEIPQRCDTGSYWPIHEVHPA